ncbi:redoxin domain-containing protein [Bacillus paralicheniformis]|nr:redoxin domain-containing protein [Bacillus paralicheniformis]
MLFISILPEAGMNRQALHFKLSTLEGGDIELKKLRGKAVVVNFWGTFCTRCKRRCRSCKKLMTVLKETVLKSSLSMCVNRKVR